MSQFYSTSLSGQYCIMTGHPTRGMDIIGPFYSEEQAEEWGEKNIVRGQWWIVTLHEPKGA